MPKRSAGLLMYRRTGGLLEVLLVHPGGPFWARRDEGAWSLPKGEYAIESESALDAAKREFAEETGFAPGSPLAALGETRLRSGKIISAWAFPGDCDPADMVSNTMEVEWPPRSGKLATFPEADRAAWFTAEVARLRIHPGQRVFIERLEGLDLAGCQGRS
jgi:predicted NUDIX family NTP pyrophosphohydrolase